MGFSSEVANKAFVACNRCCCICHKFCGTKMELHHIKQQAYGGEDTFDNCIPLCFECHADMGKADPKHPKGRRYTEEELRGHRDNWYQKVKHSISDEPSPICDKDRELFYKICNAFDGDIQHWLCVEDLRGPHLRTAFDSLERLLFDSRDPFNEFLNSDLEMQRCNLFSAISHFLHYRAINTFPIDNYLQDYNAPHIWLLNNDMIPSNKIDFENYMKNNYETFLAEGDTLNNLATEVWDKYTEFVRNGRRILGE